MVNYGGGIFSSGEGGIVVTGGGVPGVGNVDVVITNAGILNDIAEEAGLTPNWLARDAAMAALDLYTTAEELLADEVQGKIHIEVSPTGEGDYIVLAQVNTEPTVRRPASTATIRVDKGGRVLRSSRYVHARQVPSITGYVAMKMHIAFAAAEAKVQSRATAVVQAHLEAAFAEMGVKMTTRGVAQAPAGGIEFGGTYYKGGQTLPKIR